MAARPYDSDRLRKDVRDYYGTAMFNGNPMAMMELEEAERASDEELRGIARQCGIDPSRYDSPYSGATPGYGSGYGSRYSGYDSAEPSYTSPRSSSGIGVSAGVHTETIGPAATRFFEPSGTQQDSGFFASYGRSLRDAALKRKPADSDSEQ